VLRLPSVLRKLSDAEQVASHLVVSAAEQPEDDENYGDDGDSILPGSIPDIFPLPLNNLALLSLLEVYSVTYLTNLVSRGFKQAYLQ
jgi:hypothetical protein